MSLMSLITESYNEETVDTSAYDFPNITCESYELDNICESLINDVYMVDKGCMIADVIGEVQFIKEGANPVVLYEGVASGAIEKLKNVFRKFLAKIKQFFEAIKRQFLLLTKHGKEFINTFKKELTNKYSKRPKGYRYNAFKMTFDEGNKQCDNVMSKIDSKISEIATGITQSASSADALIDKNEMLKKIYGSGNVNKISLEDFQDNFIKSMGVSGNPSDTSELKEELSKSFRNGDKPGEDKMSEFEDFEDLSMDKMISFIETFDKEVKKITDGEKKFTKFCNNIIKALDKVKVDDEFTTGKNKTTGKINEAAYEYAREASSAMSHILNVGKIPTSVQTEAYKSAASMYERILKGFLRFKPAKEGTEPDGDEEIEMDEDVKEGYNLLDSVLASLV